VAVAVSGGPITAVAGLTITVVGATSRGGKVTATVEGHYVGRRFTLRAKQNHPRWQDVHLKAQLLRDHSGVRRGAVVDRGGK